MESWTSVFVYHLCSPKVEQELSVCVDYVIVINKIIWFKCGLASGRHIAIVISQSVGAHTFSVNECVSVATAVLVCDMWFSLRT